MDSELIVISNKSPKVLSGTTKSWAGFSFHEHEFYSGAPEFRFELEEPHLAFVTEGASGISAQWWARGGTHIHPWNPGRVCFINTAYELSSVSMPACRQIIVEFSQKKAVQLMGDAGDAISRLLQEHFVTEDAQIGFLLKAMQKEVAANCPSGRLFGESISVALLTYLRARYSNKNQQLIGPTHSARQIQPAVDYILDNLDSDLSLSQLAGIVGLTPQHFCYNFKATFGISPHQFVIQERIRSAKRLLVATRYPIVQIAFLVGFSSQSHFTTTFRRMTGVPPAQFRKS